MVRAKAHFWAGVAGTSPSRQVQTFSLKRTTPNRWPARSPFTAARSSAPAFSIFSPHIDWLQSMTKATRERGIIVRPVADGIAISPPLTIQQPELDMIATAIQDSIVEVMG